MSENINSNPDVLIFNLSGHSRVFATLDLNEFEHKDDIMDAYEKSVLRLHSLNSFILTEKIFGSLQVYDEFYRFRNELYKRLQMNRPPLSYIEGMPVSGNPVSAAFFNAVTNPGESVRTGFLSQPGDRDPYGAFFHSENCRFLFLNAVHGKTDPVAGNDFREAFLEAGRLVRESGFQVRDIVRSWIYLENLIPDYESFNQARIGFFQKNKIGFSPDSEELPASTCISGKSRHTGSISMDIELADRYIPGMEFKRIRNMEQSEPEGDIYLHGPAFSRGYLIKNKDFSELQVSGNASIGQNGNTLHADNPYNQVGKTLSNIRSVLHGAGMDFHDLVQTTCFFKYPAVYKSFLEVTRESGISIPGHAFVIADVCRDDLLFEMDGIAFKKNV